MLKYYFTKNADGTTNMEWNAFYYVQCVANDHLKEAVNTACSMGYKHEGVVKKLGELILLQEQKSPEYQQKKCELLLWLTKKLMKK